MDRKEKAIYDAAIAEVRGEDTEIQKEQLEADPMAWREALRQVLDETASQIEYRDSVFQDETEFMDFDSPQYVSRLAKHLDWKLSVRTFAKHINTRLRAVNRLCDDQTQYVVDFVEAVRTLQAADLDETEDDAFDNALEELYSLLERYDENVNN